MKAWHWDSLGKEQAQAATWIERDAQAPYRALAFGADRDWIRTTWLRKTASPLGECAFWVAGDEPGDGGFTQWQPSPWDAAILGRAAYRITAFQAWRNGAAEALLQTVAQVVPSGAYVFGRADARTPGLTEALHNSGFQIVEHMLSFGTAVQDWKSKAPHLVLEPLTQEDSAWAEDLAQRARNNEDRYHADPVAAPFADAFMRQWVRDGLGGFCEHAFKIRVQGQMAGFALWQGAKDVAPGLLAPAKLLLGAVDPDWQGHGAYTSLTVGGGRAMAQAGAKHIEMTTQAGNVAAVKAWQNAGLKSLGESLVTFSCIRK